MNGSIEKANKINLIKTEGVFNLMKGRGAGIPNIVKAAKEVFAGRKFKWKAGFRNFGTNTNIYVYIYIYIYEFFSLLFCVNIYIYIYIVERIDLSSLGREYARLNVVMADLGRRHKSDDFNSFLMHLFF